jgi:hypothetical protein
MSRGENHASSSGRSENVMIANTLSCTRFSHESYLPLHTSKTWLHTANDLASSESIDTAKAVTTAREGMRYACSAIDFVSTSREFIEDTGACVRLQNADHQGVRTRRPMALVSDLARDDLVAAHGCMYQWARGSTWL